MVSLESSSNVAAETKVIGPKELVAMRKVIDERITDPYVKRRVTALFTVHTKYDALNEICGKLLADDPDLACEIAEAAAGDEADRKSYLT
jgi:hypothetical protein